MVWFQFWPTWRMLFLPVFVLVAFLAALGPGLILTALNVRFRDFRFVVPFLVQFGLYVSPVGFSSALVREKFGDTGYLLYSLNPVVGVIDGFRWAILGGQTPLHLPGLAVSGAVVLASLAAGIAYFRKTERTFADII
jgi:lipopolysaccharide transport system permease protein